MNLPKPVDSQRPISPRSRQYTEYEKRQIRASLIGSYLGSHPQSSFIVGTDNNIRYCSVSNGERKCGILPYTVSFDIFSKPILSVRENNRYVRYNIIFDLNDPNRVRELHGVRSPYARYVKR